MVHRFQAWWLFIKIAVRHRSDNKEGIAIFYNKWTTCQCAWCGEEVEMLKRDLKRAGKKFCSASCSGKYRVSLRVTPPAQSKSGLRRIARKIYISRHGEPSCRKCGCLPADVHHRDGNMGNNEDSNHLPLCRSCHITHHNHERAKAA